MRCERGDVRLHFGVDVLARGDDDRLVEVVVPHLAREVRDDRVAALQREDEMVERLAEVLARGSGQRGDPVEPALEDRHDRRARRRGALLGEVEAIARLLQCRGAVEVGDPIVSERGAQLSQERFGQPGRLGIERAQPGIELLLRAAQPLRLGVGLVVARPGQRVHVGEHA